MQYRSRSASEGGGHGSYIGFSLPSPYAATEFGTYSLHHILSDEIVIECKPRPSKAPNFFMVFDAAGQPKAPPFHAAGNVEEFFRNGKAMDNDARRITQAACSYWNHALSSGGKRNTFEGFKIIDSLAHTANGTYSIVELCDDTLYVRGISSIGSGLLYYHILPHEQSRRLLFGEYYPPSEQMSGDRHDDLHLKHWYADKKLNDVYHELLTKRKSDTLFIENLRKAEQLWIKFRDAQVAMNFSHPASISNDQAFSGDELLLLISLTQKRTQELQKLLEKP
jgi:uncharacterized protein YecT (DUF1311 family)